MAVEHFASDYFTQSPIWWYTKPGFLYETLNKALREFDVLMLFNLRVFLCQLHEQIIQLHKEQSLPKMILYRGQQMPKAQFQRLCDRVGRLYSINQFLSTTTDRSVALVYAGAETSTTEPVLLEINIDPSVHKFAFADIDSLSFFASIEKEHLFSMGSIFRIESIVQDLTAGVWTVSLSLTTEKDQELNKLMSHYRDEIFCHQHTYQQLAQLLLITENYESAEFFLLRAFEVAKDNIQRSSLLNDLGLCCRKRNPHEALDYFHQSLDLQKTIEAECDVSNYASVLHNISAIHFDLNDIDLALYYLTHSYDILLAQDPENHRKLGRRLISIANIYMEKQNYSFAESASRKAIDHFEKVLPDIHPDFAVVYCLLSSCLLYQGKLYEAYGINQKAIDIALHSYPLGHSYVTELTMKLESIKKLISECRILSSCVGFVMRSGNFLMGD